MNKSENFVLSRMRSLLKERNWTIYRLAKEANLSYSSLNNIFVRNTMPSIPTLAHICNGFQISLAEFFGEIPSDSSAVILTEAEAAVLETFRSMNKCDKELFVSYLDGFARKKPRKE